MPAYNAALTLERTYADIPHDLVDQIILVDDVSHDETVEIARPARARRDHPPPEPRLRRQPEDLLRRGARGRRRHRRHAPPRLPVRRDPDPGARSPRSSDGDARPDARQPLPGRPAGRRHAALEVRQQPLPDRPSRTWPSGSTCPSTTPACGPTAGACSRPIPYQLQQRRLRLRPGADRPGRGGRAAAGSARSPSRPATSRRPARSASGGASSTASRRCGSAPASCSTASGCGRRRS